MKFKRQSRSRSQDNSVKMPLRLVVILCSVLILLVIPDLASSLPVGNLNYNNDIAINTYGPPPPRPHFNSLNNNRFYNHNRPNGNGLLRPTFYYPSHNFRLDPYYTSFNEMTHPEERQRYTDRGFHAQGIEGRGPIRFSKDYQEFLLPLSSNSNINPGNLGGANNPSHPNEGGPELSPLYIDSDQDDISSGISNGPSPLPSSSPLSSSQNQLSPKYLSLLGQSQTKRNAGGGYMCHFKLCQSQMGVSWKRLWNPSVGSSNGEASRSTP